ncbi:lysozyme inhibitor LprI family protein [Pseudomonas sp. UV AK001]|uniref:lysozyme inhibitor LprI family protein n=1 Tax=Pseudomonas sp. UV AK001 TaxID=3384791 RepID=UPI0038D3F8B9
MKRFVFTLLAVLLPVSSVYAQDDCSHVTSSLEMVPCSEAAKKAADTQLNVSYKQLMARLESDYRADPALGAEYAAKVKESQRAWLKLRDANCPLEAFEIETGMPAHVFAVNSCIARMSRERSAYLDKIVPALASDKSTSTAPANGACPSEEFPAFLTAFSASSESQRRLTAMTVKSLVLKPVAGKDRSTFEPSTSGVSGASFTYPLMAAITPGKTPGVEIEEVDDSHINVVDKRAGNSNVKIFNFSRQACWVLEGIEDWSVSEKDLVATRNPGMSRAENFCEQRAEALGGLGFLEQYPLTVELIEASLENYVCAAESGDPEASESAARLSLSQMASQLETSKVEALFKAASKTPSGALGYASFFCMGNSTDYDGPCLHPKQAEEQVIRAISMGSVDGMNYLASSFEAGDLGTKDMSRALACYQMAADKGDQAGARNVQRLTSQGADTIKASHCI